MKHDTCLMSEFHFNGNISHLEIQNNCTNSSINNIQNCTINYTTIDGIVQYLNENFVEIEKNFPEKSKVILENKNIIEEGLKNGNKSLISKGIDGLKKTIMSLPSNIISSTLANMILQGGF